jgi:hypothetical protein
MSESGGYYEVYDTLTEMDPSEPLGQLALVRDPLGLYVFTSTGGYVLVASPAVGSIPPVPASETGQGVVELATAAEVGAGTAGILVARYFDKVDGEARDLYQEFRETPPAEVLERQREGVDRILPPPDAYTLELTARVGY